MLTVRPSSASKFTRAWSQVSFPIGLDATPHQAPHLGTSLGPTPQVLLTAGCTGTGGPFSKELQAANTRTNARLIVATSLRDTMALLSGQFPHFMRETEVASAK